MEFNNVEKEILKAIYKKDTDGGKVNFDELALTHEGKKRNYELGFYLLKLERFGYLRFDGDPFTKGGKPDEDYNNNIIMTWFDKIYITEKGIDAVNQVV